MPVTFDNLALARKGHTITGRKQYVETKLNQRHSDNPAQADADKTAVYGLVIEGKRRGHVRKGRQAYLNGRIST